MLGLVEIAVGEERQAFEADGVEDLLRLAISQASISGANFSWFSQR